MYHSQAEFFAMIRMRKCPARFQAAATAAFPLSEPLSGSVDFYLPEPPNPWDDKPLPRKKVKPASVSGSGL
jgi:hypothetical protein